MPVPESHERGSCSPAARRAGETAHAHPIEAAPIVRITKVVRRARSPEGMPVADPQMGTNPT
ncbi:hypothetical protein ACWD6I_25355, partial [Streptomyces sp. NPDC002454]